MAESPTPPPIVSPALRTPRRQINRTVIGLNVFLQVILVFVIIFFVNTYSFRHFTRWDLSHNQNYALSPKTKNLVSHLEQPVAAIVFFPQAQVLAKDVTGLLREYEYESGKKFSVEYVDPYKNLVRAQELADKYKFKEQDNIVILEYKGKNKFVNAQDMAEIDNSGAMMNQPPVITAFKGEEAITSALQSLVQEKENILYALTGHGEPNLDRDPVQNFKAYVSRENIKLLPLNLSEKDTIPPDATGLLILGPKNDFTERDISIIDNFWNQRKGRLFIALNPAGKTPRLDEWLTFQGVKPQGDRVLRTGSGLSMEDGVPTMKSGLIFTSPMVEFPEVGKAITKELAGGEMQFLGATESLLPDQARAQLDKARVVPVINAGKGFWGEVDYVAGENRNLFFDPKKDHLEPPVGVAVEKGAMEDARVKVDTARMIIVGNSSFLTDDGYRVSKQGIDFALFSLNWILNRELISGIPPKPKEARSLSLPENSVRNVRNVAVLYIPLAAGIFGLYVSWHRRNRNLLTLTVWLLGVGLFIFGGGWAVYLWVTSRESGVSNVAVKDYLIPAALFLVPLAAFLMFVLKPRPLEASAPAETV